MSEDVKLLPCRKCGAVPDILECDWTTPVTYHAACKCNLPDFFTREACAAHWNTENAAHPSPTIAHVEKLAEEWNSAAVYLAATPGTFWQERHDAAKVRFLSALRALGEAEWRAGGEAAAQIHDEAAKWWVDRTIPATDKIAREWIEYHEKYATKIRALRRGEAG